jgi:hypothetical protein
MVGAPAARSPHQEHAMRHRLALASLIAAAACSDATGTSTGDALTPQERAWLATTLGAQTGAAAGARTSSLAADVAARSAAGVPAPFQFSLDATVPCPMGGSTKVTAAMRGTLDEGTRSVTADLEGSLAPAGCVVRSDEGISFTLTGTPGLASEAHVVFTNGQPTGEHTASLDGAFSWSASDGRSGSCTVDYTAKANHTTNQATLNGSFCGSTVSWAGPVR